MKQMITLLMLVVLAFGQLTAQPPQAFKYQAIIRNSAGEILQNQAVGMRISIRNVTATGTIVYQETFATITNNFGLVELEIGKGTAVVGTFSAVNWQTDSKFIEIEVDPAGGSNYLPMGVSELLSVPYAFQAGHSADSYWQSSSNNIYFNTGNVGIGNTAPAYPLYLTSSSGISWVAGIYNSSFSSLSNGLTVRANGGDPLRLQNSTSDLLVVRNNGYVGIGTILPSYKLDIEVPTLGLGLRLKSQQNNSLFRMQSDLNESAEFYMNSAGANTILLSASGSSYINGGSLGLGTSSPSNAKLEIEGTGAYDAIIKLDNTGTNGASFFIGSTNSAWGGGANQNLFVMGHGAPASANIDMVVTSTGRLGIGTTAPTAALEVTSASGTVIYGHSSGGTGVYGSSGTSTGVFGQSSSGFAGFFSGSVYVSGALSKGSGSFVIDHPLDPENKLLRHNFVESPENLLIYRGKVKIDQTGTAMVIMPDYYIALTREDEATIQLTPIGKSPSQNRVETCYEWSDTFEFFTIFGEPGREVSWMVLADRDDPVIHVLNRPVVEEKGPANIFCDKGKLLYPEAFGYPESYGSAYETTKLNAHETNH